jgi:hypothetical protein
MVFIGDYDQLCIVNGIISTAGDQKHEDGYLEYVPMIGTLGVTAIV